MKHFWHMLYQQYQHKMHWSVQSVMYSMSNQSSHSHSLSNICPDQMLICMSQDGLSEGGCLVFDASDVVGLIAVVFNLTKRQKRLRQLRRGSSCLPMSPSVIYTVTASYGRQQKATYCRKT